MWTGWSGSGPSGRREGLLPACAWVAAHLPIELVTDARVIRDYYLAAYGRTTDFFPYGTTLGSTDDDGTLDGSG